MRVTQTRAAKSSAAPTRPELARRCSLAQSTGPT
jgi:hypothetical protein